VPGLTITAYRKAGRMPMWITSANLAGAGPQIRPGLLAPPAIASRTQQSRQLVGSHAIAAVNGDFYDMARDEAPWGPEVARGGTILKGSSAPQYQSFVMQKNGVAAVALLAVDVTLHHGSKTVAAHSLNSAELPADGIAVLTARWGHASRAYLHPTQPVREYFVSSRGVVIAVKNGISATPIPRNGKVIVAQGSARQRLADAGIGRLARISVTTRTRTGLRGGVYSAIGVGMILIRNGIDARLGCGKQPPVARTIVGIKPGGLTMFVVTVEGQTDSATSHFSGLTVQQAQGLMRALGAYDAAMFDGGGSTILTARIGKAYRMLTRPPGGAVRPVSNSLAFWPR
jgi:hypothetical protein